MKRFFHTVDIFCSIVKADDRLRALREPLQRQHGKLHDAGKNRHRADRGIAAIFQQAGVKADGQCTFCKLHDKRRQSERQAWQDKFLLRAQVAEPYPQGTMRSGQKTQNPDTGNTL